MLKSLVITLLISSSLFATINEDIESFLYENFEGNKNIKSINIKIVSKTKIKSMKGWNAFIVDVNAIVKPNRKVKQKMIWFSDGTVITQDLIDLQTGISFKDYVSPKFKDEYYKKENLIYGNANARNKVVIFSDPLCPFCRGFVPDAIKYMKKYPKKFAVYYFHFPLPSLHPAAVELVKAAYIAEDLGKKDVVLNLYKVKVDGREKDIHKILRAFNKVFGTKIKPADLKTLKVAKHFEKDLEMADNVMVQGTPTLFFNGTLDKTKKKYLKAK